jgi:hypothetical protein
MKSGTIVLCGILSLYSTALKAEPLPLTNPTATYSQTLSGFFSIASAIDPDTTTSGWAVQEPNGYGGAETAVFETLSNAGFADGTKLTFQLKTSYVNEQGSHNLGRFRLSITTDDRATFANGLASGGDVTANWTVLIPFDYYSAAGALLTKQSDLSLLASGTNAGTEIYYLSALTYTTNITGVRLETLQDDSLPHGGPGRSANGNFVLVNFSVSAEPFRPDLLTTIHASAVDICWAGRPTQLYQVQYALDAQSTNWFNLGSPVEGTGTNCFTDSIDAIEKRFYRVIRVP